MLVDVHAHVWDSSEQLGPHWSEAFRRHAAAPWSPADASPQAFDRAMGPVRHAVLLGVVSRLLGIDIPAGLIAREVRRRPGRYVGFAGIDASSPSYRDDLDAAVALGLAGVTVSPAGQGVALESPAALDLLQRCARRRLPVMLLSELHGLGPARLALSQPAAIDAACLAVPDLRLIVGGAGDPWMHETLLLLGKHANLYADLSGLAGAPWRLYETLVAAHERGVAGKLLTGSGFPRATPAQLHAAVSHVNRVRTGTDLPSVPAGVIDGLLGRDALRLLGIPAPVEAAATKRTTPDIEELPYLAEPATAPHGTARPASRGAPA